MDRALIDGEAVVLRDGGGSDVGALLTKRTLVRLISERFGLAMGSI